MPAIWPYLLILANTQETNVVSRARFFRKLRQEPFSMGLLGEALFLCLGELKSASRYGPVVPCVGTRNDDKPRAWLNRGVENLQASPSVLGMVIPLGQIPMYA